MKRIFIITVLAMLASAGCRRSAGPGTVETADVPVPSRPVSKLMPVESLPEITTAVEPIADTREPTPVVTPAPAPVKTHTIRTGETLWSVAKKFYGNGQRWREIAAANDIADESKIPIGKVLRIP